MLPMVHPASTLDASPAEEGDRIGLFVVRGSGGEDGERGDEEGTGSTGTSRVSGTSAGLAGVVSRGGAGVGSLPFQPSRGVGGVESYRDRGGAKVGSFLRRLQPGGSPESAPSRRPAAPDRCLPAAGATAGRAGPIETAARVCGVVSGGMTVRP